MVTVDIDVTKSVEENAARYFEEAKRAKRKLEGAAEAYKASVAAYEKARKEKDSYLARFEEEERRRKRFAQRRRHWYEKFRWFYSSDGFLCVGGRDSTTNEVLIKKHAEPGDKVLHTDMAGAPFYVVKAKGRPVPQTTLEQAGVAAASFSKAWKSDLTTAEVFHVDPDQVSKTAETGEYLTKGAFVIRGKTRYLHPRLELGAGLFDSKDEIIMVGPRDAVMANCGRWLEVSKGALKTSDAAKRIQNMLGGELDQIIQQLPPGGVSITAPRERPKH
ncbi:DUF814 domain-containing protein [Candidatus Woesearchaeota archaeon]|nr:DUF814 domain-containing protein [Candidatus Woesearchaeota archaeon]